MTKFWLKYPKFYDYIQILATGGFLEEIAKAVPELKRKNILDLGCGTGNLIYHIKPKGYLGLDINPNFIYLARHKFPKYKFEVLDLVKGDLPKKRFDYVFIMNVLHHLTDRQVAKVLSKLKNWRRSKNLVIVESRPTGFIGNFLESLDAGENFRSFDKAQKLISKDWKIEKQRIVKAPLKTYEYLVVHCKARS